MWMVDPETMCDRHLLGEHVEIHMLAGTLARHRSIDGFIAKGLLEPGAMHVRHEALVAEMGRRGFRHRSPLPAVDLTYLPLRAREARVDSVRSGMELAERCTSCRDNGCDDGRRRTGTGRLATDGFANDDPGSLADHPQRIIDTMA